MSSKPLIFRATLLILLTFGNSWIWTIQKINFPIFSLLISTTLLIFLSDIKPKTKPLLLLSFLLLLVFQYQTTHKTKVTAISPLEKDAQLRRTNYYPHPFRLIESPHLRIFSHLKQNFFSALDQNIYFFAYHPREDNSLDIYPKFSFLLLPFFLLGLFRLIKQKQYLPLYLAIATILLVTIIGNKNPLGTFTLFPLIIFCLYKGIIK